MSSDREIVSTRVFDAPRERVFQAWTDPEHLARWWGPKGFTNTFHEFDPRPGGVWGFVMHGPDGVDYKNRSVFVEIVKPERIVFDHVSGPREAGPTRGRADEDGVTMTMLIENKIEVDAVPHSRSRGSRASRRPSPRRLKPRTTSMMASPGTVATWGAVIMYA